VRLDQQQPASTAAQPQIVILGAGMSGLCMGIRLLQSGVRSFTILEMASGLGGTWWDNTYPGAQCDVRSHLYSFSFEPNPDWSRVYAPQREILAYMQRLADKWSLHDHIRLNTELACAHFDEARGLWVLCTRAGEELLARVLVCSTGPLSQPRYPDIAGLARFGGKVMHSARWDHSYDFDGKAVAVIGTAASAVQLVPKLAPAARQLHIFQRTPNWIVPRPDRAYRPWEKALSRLPPFGRMQRWYQYWVHERNRLGFNQGSAVAAFFERIAAEHLRRQIADPALRARLRPTYPLGCKRVLLSNDYYPTLARPNVELVTAPIECVQPGNIVTADGQHRAIDAIVCATGFDTLHMLGSVDVRGLGGQPLAAVWKQAPQAYHGISVAGFPNLFLLLGPNTGTGHTSTLLYIEAQVNYTLQCLRELQRRRKVWLAVRPEVMDGHNRQLQATLSTTVWAGPCSSWYKTAGRWIAAIYPGFSFQYTRAMRRPRFEDYVFG
jgi:cation diffusion facilitator CzcD-associated flavoprotein CzcO